jgi:FdhD protein
MQKPLMSDQGLTPSSASSAMDELGELRECEIAAERPLTLYLDKRELVTLMTLGSQPELLTLGYLRNQGLIRDLGQIRAVQVDWDVESAVVSTRSGVDDLEQRLSRRTVTSGCGQGTVFGDMMGELDRLRLPQAAISQSVLYRLLGQLRDHNEVYRRAGAVHGCALCNREDILVFVEDVGRHNAVDAIAGHMWLENTEGTDKIFYTTGRLTSEMVIKVAQMGIPVLLSRSGITQMGLGIARQVGVTLIARAKGRHFLVFNGSENMVFDAVPVRPAAAARETRRDSRAL